MGESELALLVDDCYSAVFEPRLWVQVLDSISAAIGAKGIVIVSHNPLRTATAIASAGLEAANADYRSGWWRFDTRIAKTKTAGLRIGLVATDDGLITEEEKRRDPFFQDFSRRHGLGDLAAYPVIDPVDRSLLSVSAFRDARHGAYEAADVTRLQVLAPHVVRAAEMTARFAEAKAHAEDLLSSLDRMRFGILLLDRSGSLRYANAVAQGFMPAYVRLDADRRPRATVAADRPKLDRLVAGALPGAKLGSGTAFLLHGSVPDRPLFVEVTRLNADSPALSQFGGALGAILITLRDLFAPPSRPIIDELIALGLTRCEARVAMLVGRGQSPRGTAEALHIAEGTVRVQLRSCYAKLGLNRQSELAVLVTRLDDGAGP